jgi:hypothetical protein
MKKLVLFLGVLLSLGMFSACSDDAMNELMESKLSLFNDSLQSVPENDYTGFLYYDSNYGWTIEPLNVIDYSCWYYFPLNLPDEFKANKGRGLKVSYSGKVVQLSEEEVESLHLWRYDGTEKFYFVYLTKIEIMEDLVIPYRGNPPFTITDMPGTMVDFNTGTWYISYIKDHTMVNLYCPTELNEEYKVQGMNVVVSGNVFEEVDNPNMGDQKVYKINLTNIEKAE